MLRAQMPFKIEKSSSEDGVLLRLFGRLRAEDLEELKKEVGSTHPQVNFDLQDVTLVDLEIVRFLLACETSGINLVRCPLYVREWIRREKERQN
jgi:hypothetical protein